MILVSCTLPPYKFAGDHRHWSSWLRNAEAVQESVDEEVRYYAALEVDGRGLVPFAPLLPRLHHIEQVAGEGEVGAVWHTFSYDDKTAVRDTSNRLVRICTGQNFGAHYAMEQGASHVLFVASDVVMPDDVLPRLLELDWPICGLNVPTYCLDGRRIELDDYDRDFVTKLGPYQQDWPKIEAGWDVRIHMQSAALLLVRRDIFTRLRWRVDRDCGLTDDPAYHADARELLGWETLVRHDVQASHYPEAVGAMETRHTEEQRTVVR